MVSMKIATWNVNSIRARLDRLLAWLAKARPDVLCLQELKVTDAEFPHAQIEAAGYRAAVFGQKTYNGVALLSRSPAENVQRGLPGLDDSQARLISADIEGLRVASAYFPNGQEVGTEKYAYKLAWIRRLQEYMDASLRPTDRLVLCGDFNVARDDKDVARPDQWAGSVLFHADARTALEAVLAWGLVDLVRQLHPEGGLYSWWDYRMLAFPRNNGLRLDYICATPPVARRAVDAQIDREERKGEKPSDHAPVVVTLADAAE